MKLFTVQPSCGFEDSHRDYVPTVGIHLEFIDNVPCLSAGSFRNILPVVLQSSTIEKFDLRNNTKENRSKLRDFKLIQASLHKSPEGVLFLQEEDSSKDDNVIVSLKKPLSAAQPYYEFEGDTEILSGDYSNYYSSFDVVEKENILCSAIVRMADKSKVSFTYTNRNGQGIQIKYLMDTKFE
jgi:hypothetical protein